MSAAANRRRLRRARLFARLQAVRQSEAQLALAAAMAAQAGAARLVERLAQLSSGARPHLAASGGELALRTSFGAQLAVARRETGIELTRLAGDCDTARLAAVGQRHAAQRARDAAARLQQAELQRRASVEASRLARPLKGASPTHFRGLQR